MTSESTTTTSPFAGHIVGIAGPAWGHLKPLAALASKIVQERSDILVTLLVVGDFDLRVEEEISRCFPEHFKDTPKYNIRVINMGGEGANLLSLFPVLIQNFGRIYTKLANSEPVLCATGKLYDSPLRPTVAIVDLLLPEIVQDIRKAGGNDTYVTVLGLITGNATYWLSLLRHEKYGGYGDLATKAHELAAATGKTLAEVGKDLFYQTKGGIVTIPGLPPMFDYEYAPQESNINYLQIIVFKKTYLFMTLCDGIITTTSAAFEPEAHEVWQKWLAESNRSYYVLGPLQPQRIQSGTKQTDMSNSQNGQELLEFLDSTLTTHGSNSLLYISFGSLVWPKDEHIWKLVDVLLDLKIPFILAHASPMAIIPTEVSAKVKASGIGMLSPWTPQELILAHPSTGWFLSHCGQNSVTESICQGIPMIAWPIISDEPVIAARLTLALDVAFELIEVRTGHGLKPLYRGITPTGSIDAVESEFRDVLQNARGGLGDRKRRNAHALRDVMNGAWVEEGDAYRTMRKFLNDMFP